MSKTYEVITQSSEPEAHVKNPRQIQNKIAYEFYIKRSKKPNNFNLVHHYFLRQIEINFLKKRLS